MSSVLQFSIRDVAGTLISSGTGLFAMNMFAPQLAKALGITIPSDGSMSTYTIIQLIVLSIGTFLGRVIAGAILQRV